MSRAVRPSFVRSPVKTRLTPARRPSAVKEDTEEPVAATGALPSCRESTAAAERHGRIAERAYRFAEARGFTGDHQLDDWLAAEREVDETAPGKT
jgi:Protein of unknown function (DUF2934)